MADWRKKLENMFAASAFAEMGEPDTALDIAGIRRRPAKEPSLGWDRVFAATTFAEAGCPEDALEFLNANPPRPQNLETFLDAVGLRNVRICYGMVEA